ncbi:molybdenum cofactor biosynthesis protein MoaE [Chitiniphilus shinanonensis]|uniref:Molybdopterin synthase catalytic subunit n=1 Tax=Chitiniphilus shinanonensis TaxID=553088 RepID=A0ABQ6BW10_9NEIS|nr:molybdenum cofactor biosynthesis protein MoaE [Chitiniphilus shinanonensis]GLS06165.1 molybdenum cofactor biosynthesis protein MoaE [Chitiniphilus shinanonensis]
MARCHVSVQHADFDFATELGWLGDGSGAVASFIGRVRDDTRDGVPLTAMTLEHYPGMTERVLEELAQAVAARFALDGVLVLHRVGRLLPGEQIVLVVATAPHRHAALQAVDCLMDHLKSVAPFWKCEEYGAARHWVDARDSDQAALARWGAL